MPLLFVSTNTHPIINIKMKKFNFTDFNIKSCFAHIIVVSALRVGTCVYILQIYKGKKLTF